MDFLPVSIPEDSGCCRDLSAEFVHRVNRAMRLHQIDDRAQHNHGADDRCIDSLTQETLKPPLQ